ncbi:hypothetical protein TSUD_215820 [Trifolium subterraneum]|uniref:TF-B3 domain-containing protein n=1 Tax=Trifolium subterraneum TaxID=3900 RepID=A0A2Z6M6W7_TRISU|nr:hypothetical protein TSUD_215820 [Trifolium subterraneum]
MFRTIVDPRQERIEICPRFRAEWSDELKNHPYAFLLHSSGNLVFLELELEGGDCYMTPGKMVSVLCGFKKPVEVIFRYDFSDDDNCFTIESVDGRRVAGVIGSDVEGRDIIDLSDDTTYTLHGYHNDRVFGWEMIVTDAYACESNEQVLHVPPRTANGALRDCVSVIIRTQQKLDGQKFIKTYTRNEGGKAEMYLTGGWYEFKKANGVRKGDKFQFQLSDPPYVMVVDIVRCGGGNGTNN